MEAARIVPNIIGGLDSTNAAHVIATDTGGRQIISGAAANGAAIEGDPVLTAGTSGNMVHTIKSDPLGELIVQALLQDNSGTVVLSTTNDNSVVGLNAYSLRPKVKFYTIGGTASSTAETMFMGPNGSKLFYDATVSFGQNNVKTWYAYVDTATTLTYEFVDSTGTIGTYSHPVPATTWTTLPKALNTPGQFLINHYTSNTNLTPLDGFVYICYTNTDLTTCMYGGNYEFQDVSLFTVPAGHVAFISNFSFSAQSADYPALVKWSPSGIRSVAHVWNEVTNLYLNYYNEFGGIGGVFTAGESFCLVGLSYVTGRNFSATVVCMPI